MTSEVEAEQRSILPTNRASSVADALNLVLADSFTLFMKTKNFHWHMSGSHFRDYHLLLDDQSKQILATTDLMAERVRKIGQPTLRSIGDVSRRSSIADNDHPYVEPLEMLEELRRDNIALIENLRELKAIADDANDNATSGVVDNWTDEAEERAWFLFETTRAG